MKKQSYLALLLSLLLLSGCSHGESELEIEVDSIPDPTQSPITETVKADAKLSYSLRENRIYYPEGTTEADADYILSYELPEFSHSPAAASMNEALQLYTEELQDRIRSERLPLADRAAEEEAPFTRVYCTLEEAGDCISLILFEEVSFDGTNLETYCSTLVFDQRGAESSLYAQSLLYDPEDLVAQQVYNVIDRDDPARLTHYGDLTLEDIRQNLDLRNGFARTEKGYRVYFKAGVLADEAAGIQAVEFPEAGLYPDFVGDVIPEGAYADLLLHLDQLCAAAALQYRSFSEGAPDAYTATRFMAEQFSDRPLENGAYRVLRTEYEDVFYRYFRTLPRDLENGDGTVLEGDYYRIPPVQEALYGLRPDNAQKQGDGILLYATLYSGRPGDAQASELTALTILLKDNGRGGYLFESFSM